MDIHGDNWLLIRFSVDPRHVMYIVNTDRQPLASMLHVCYLQNVTCVLSSVDKVYRHKTLIIHSR